MTTNVKNMTMVIPDTIPFSIYNFFKPQMNIFNYISQYGSQNIMYPFYNTVYLDMYESLFDEYYTAFVPLGYAVRYINVYISEQ